MDQVFPTATHGKPIMKTSLSLLVPAYNKETTLETAVQRSIRAVIRTAESMFGGNRVDPFMSMFPDMTAADVVKTVGKVFRNYQR